MATTDASNCGVHVDVLNLPRRYWAGLLLNASVRMGLQCLCANYRPNTSLANFLYGFRVVGPPSSAWVQLFEACLGVGVKSPDLIAALVVIWSHEPYRSMLDRTDLDSPNCKETVPWQRFIRNTLQPALYGNSKSSIVPGIVSLTRRNWITWYYAKEHVQQRVLKHVESAVSVWTVRSHVPQSTSGSGRESRDAAVWCLPRSYTWCRSEGNGDAQSDGGLSDISMCSSNSGDGVPNYYSGHESTCGEAVQAIARRVTGQVIAKWRPLLVQVFEPQTLSELADAVQSRATQLLFDKMWACATCPQSFEDESPLCTE